MRKLFLRNTILFLIFGFAYIGIEIVFRGFSHISMFLIGGLCGVLIGLINEYFTYEMAICSQMVISSFIITTIEFLTGCIVNLWLGLNVWDYSDQQYNLLGQICLLFSTLGFFLSFAAIIVDDYLRFWLFDEEKPHYKWL